MNTQIKNFLKFLLFFSIGATILYFVYQSQSESYAQYCAEEGIPSEDCSLIGKLLDDFTKVNYFWVVMIVVAFMISNVSRALRWNQLTRSLGYTPKFYNAFHTVMLGYFANLGIPRSGEVLRAASYSRYEKIPLEKVMGTIVVDRALDVICLASLIGLAFLLEYDTIWNYLSTSEMVQDRLGVLTLLLQIGIGLGVVSLVLIYIFRKQIMASALYKKIEQIILGFWDGLKTIAQLDNPWIFLFHTFVIWFMYYIMTYFALISFPPTANLGFVVALVVFVFGGLGIVIPAPGGMGTYHALVIIALSFYTIGEGDGFSLANIAFFSINIFANIFFGILAVILLPILNRE